MSIHCVQKSKTLSAVVYVRRVLKQNMAGIKTAYVSNHFVVMLGDLTHLLCHIRLLP